MKWLGLVMVMFTLFTIDAGAQNAPLHYRLGMSKPHSHYFEVELDVPTNNQPKIQLVMPVWTPGSYLVREYAKNVQEFHATDASGRDLPFVKTNKDTWEITTQGSQSIVARYKVYAYEISVRNSFLDESHGYLNPASIFMMLEGMKDQAIRLDITPYQGWREISTGLDRMAGPAGGREGRVAFIAPNFDILVDSPIEIGNHSVYNFEVAGVPHQLAIYGTGNHDPAKMVEDIKKIVESARQIFGGLPYSHYTFLIQLLENGGGGLEHLNSTSIEFSRFSFKPEKTYHRALGTIAHEYFHAWNVKRIRPKALGPFDYENENYTHMLWVAEGFTDFYAGQLMLRSGLYSVREYWDNTARAIKTLQMTPGRLVQPVAESSFDAWIKGYRPTENSINSEISYYTKGHLIGLLLDLELRQRSNGERSLDDVMRFLFHEYYEKQGRGYSDEEFQQACEKVAGEGLNDFFKQYVTETTELDYDHYLNYAGVKLTAMVDEAKKNYAYLGAVLVDADGHPILLDPNGRALVSRVLVGTPAADQGIYVNDEIIAINGFRVTATSLDDRLGDYRPGETVKITLSRRGELKELSITLGSRPPDNFRISKVDNPTAQQKQIFKSWVRQDFDSK